MTPPTAVVDDDVIDRIAALLPLRTPNKDALASVAHRLAAAQEANWEGVVDVATGVGKTWVLAGLIDYLVETAGVRHFMVVTPGDTIKRKTIENFTPGGRKSLVGTMAVTPYIVTADNFTSPDVRRALDDPDEIKLFIFTVQSLLRPRDRSRRRVRTFQEGLGAQLYTYLEETDDLVIFADEHHCYTATGFSDAVRALHPFALVGLTATPHPSTPASMIVYRYPLAHAIADHYVKIPVIVGRTDDRSDNETKLRDGLALLKAKETALERYCAAEGLPVVHPIMLVVAPSIAEAKEVEDLLSDPDFFGGHYANSILRIDADAPDKSLEDLETVEDPTSPVRVIVSVNMLKEGWDVANVYVIVSLRALVSEILTEQTLGRGLRLPFGHYTRVELLDTLEVVAHEKYEDLLRRARVLKQRLIDWHTIEDDEQQAAARRALEAVAGGTADGSGPDAPGAGGFPTAAITGIIDPDGAEGGAREELELVLVSTGDAPVTGTDVITTTTVEQRTAQAQKEAEKVANLSPNPAYVPIKIPALEIVPNPPQFSLLDVGDMDPFRSYGRRLAINPSDELRRSKITATVHTGLSGIPEVELATVAAEDRIYSQGVLIDSDEARRELLKRLLAAPQVPVTENQIAAAQPIVDAFLAGLGAGIEHIGAWLDQAAGGLVELVQERLEEMAGPVTLSESVEVGDFAAVRTGRALTSTDLLGEFTKGVGYKGSAKSLYDEDWFDSRPERDLANILDHSDDVTYWVRLQRNDMPLLWRGQDSWYNPDFLVTETDSDHWVVEVKRDKDMTTDEVQGKKEAAERWARRVNASGKVGKWRYLLVSETQLNAATGDWRRLKALYTGE